MEKIIVIGCPGSGKSTFAKALHNQTGIPLVHLDMLFWNTDKTTVDRSVFRERLAEEMAQSRWIIDGNYASTMELRLQNCDTVFFLDYPIDVCLEGIRERLGKPRSDMPWVETEEDPEFMEFVKTFRTEGRPEILDLLGRYSDKTVYTFTSREDAQQFITQL